MNCKEIIIKTISDSIKTKNAILTDDGFIEDIRNAAYMMYNSINDGGKVVLAGNGGSASDCLHIAGEIVGRFQKERKAWPAIVLNADVATMTAIANDYGYDEIFSRQAEGHVKKGDIFIGISTSGNSESIIRAIHKAHELGGSCIGFTGKTGGKMKDICDLCLVVPSNNTARIQESHIMIGHTLCELLEELMIGTINE